MIALLILIGTVYLGIKANAILSHQNAVVESQITTSARLGRQQNQAALLQAYTTSVAAAGYESEESRRMLHMALDLYSLLVQEDHKFTMLYTSMPSLTEDQLGQLVEARPADRDAIRQLFARRNDVSQALGGEGSYRIIQNAPFHIVIGTFRIPAYARNALASARSELQSSSFRPFMNIVQNEDRLYLATLSGFATRDEVLEAMRRERLQTRFSSVYAAQARGWRSVCSAHFAPCGPQLNASPEAR